MIPLFKVFMGENVLASLSRTLYSGYIGQGPKVDEFEKKLALFVGADHCVSVNSGTSGLHLALHLIGVNGGEVITSPMTCTATNWPILGCGGKIVWCDIQPDTGNIDPGKIERLITEKTRAIMVVHWGGMPCDMDEIHEVAKRHGLPVIEDAAHAFGAMYQGKKIGSISDYTMFSFQAIKHLTCVDGGALFVRDKEQYRRAKLTRWYGIDREGSRKDFRCEEDIGEWGFKFHMNDVCATIGLSNLEHVNEVLEKNRWNAKYLDVNLAGIPGLEITRRTQDRLSSFWLYTILAERRDDLFRKLNQEGVMASRVHERNDKHSCMSEFKVDLPCVDLFTSKMLCIPVGWWVSESDLAYIVSTIRAGW